MDGLDTFAPRSTTATSSGVSPADVPARAARGPRPAAWVGLAAAAWLLSAAAAWGQSLDRQVRNLLGESKLASAQVAVSIIDCRTGEVEAALNERTAMIPASNLKLLTSGAALQVLGPDFEFRTRLIRDGDRLVLIGAGDPAFADPALLDRPMQLSVSAFLDRLVQGAKKAGVSGVREVIVDDRIFDRDLVHPSWPEAQLNRWYCAPVSGANFHANILEVFARAGARPGIAPGVRTEPSAPWIELVNSAQTVATGSTSLWATREGATARRDDRDSGRPAAPAPGGGAPDAPEEPHATIASSALGPFRFRLMGSVRATPVEPIEVTIADPAAMLARLLHDRVAAEGLLAPDALPARLARAGETFDERTVVAVVRTPIDVVLKRCNTQSHNLYAEALLKRIGHAVTGQPGSWSNGASVVRMTVAEQLGVDAADLMMADGSGLSRDNRVTALLLARFLAAIAENERIVGPFVESLARPGEGTFERRFRDTPLNGRVAGKSGFISGVQCLSGYVIDEGTGRKFAFSILVNNITSQVPGGAVKAFHEDVVELIDKHLTRTAPRSPAVGG